MSSPAPGTNPLEPFLERQGVVILDGGLATELETRGCDLSDDLWSARLLFDEPDLIGEVHSEYLHAGADCVVSASYQATLEGFVRHGCTEQQGIALLERSVQLADEARSRFWDELANRTGRLRPIVAASVGPYGAFLADGSEYGGDYRMTLAELEEFHRQRWQVLAGSGADLLACETLPSRREAQALRRLLEAGPMVVAWFSFSCRDGKTLRDGTPIRQVVGDLDDCSRIVAIGVNCTEPRHVSSLIDEVRAVSAKAIVVYPNSGEAWDATERSWRSSAPDEKSWLSRCSGWVDQGAKLVGGCCRTGPREIAAIRASLLSDLPQIR